MPKTSANEPEKPKSKDADKDANESLSSSSTVPDEHDGSGGQASRYIDWATLMKRTFGIDPLPCPKCEARMKVLAVISQPEVIDKILAHVGLPVEPEVLADGCTLAFDVTGEPIPDWAVGTDPQSDLHGYERGPPCALTARPWASAQACSSTYMDSGQLRKPLSTPVRWCRPSLSR